MSVSRVVRGEPARPGSPIAPLYLSLGWSPDLRRSFLDERAALERESARLAALAELEPGTYLPELIIMHRRVMIRAAIKQNGAPLQIQCTNSRGWRRPEAGAPLGSQVGA
jgi:hypothetical protein